MENYLAFIFDNKIYVTYLMEFIAALAGSLFLYKSVSVRKDVLIFVRFLWSVLIIDILGGYAALAYFDNYEHFVFLKDTVFVRNEWYYNIAEVYFICVYTYLLREQLSGKKPRNVLKWCIYGYIIFSVLNMFRSENFFNGDMMFNDIVGTFIILLAVFLYFYEMMISDKVLSFYRKLFFYVAVSISISYLVRVPISIYGAYVTEKNTEFLELFYDLIRYSNVYMYSFFAIGFYIYYRNSKKNRLALGVRTT
ncbi:hypothetical protein ML462_11050 [Gramella lutea]|uniref:Uncharacterized protein n=1 Tax=Christiangramia lutea TaxID=1607951 RepID=A0A9X2ABU6_9FLAO|nr:hypothetical protein [Christiangramia lutea]MCH4823707.1 hypothetical protein [Christiangramia lutea]